MASTPVSNPQTNGTPHDINEANSGSLPQRLTNGNMGDIHDHHRDSSNKRRKRRKLDHTRSTSSSRLSAGDNVTPRATITATDLRVQDRRDAASGTVNRAKRRSRCLNGLLAFCIAASVILCFFPLVNTTTYITAPVLVWMTKLPFQSVEIVLGCGRPFMLAVALLAGCVGVYKYWPSGRVRVRMR